MKSIFLVVIAAAASGFSLIPRGACVGKLCHTKTSSETSSVASIAEPGLQRSNALANLGGPVSTPSDRERQLQRQFWVRPGDHRYIFRPTVPDGRGGRMRS